MLAADLGDLGLFLHVAGRFTDVAMTVSRSEVRFAMLSAVDQGDDVIRLPGLARLDHQFAQVADAVVAVEDALAHTRRYVHPVVLADPFGDGAAHRVAPQILGTSCAGLLLNLRAN